MISPLHIMNMPTILQMKRKATARKTRGRMPRTRHATRYAEERKYWRNIWNGARRILIDMPGMKWCDYWHIHFDWESRGKHSRHEHRRHIRPLMHAFARAQGELRRQSTPYQIFVCIHPSDPGSDALYIHTPNPQTEFPVKFNDCRFSNSIPPLLMGLVNAGRYEIGISEHKGSIWYTVIPKKFRTISPP